MPEPEESTLLTRTLESFSALDGAGAVVAAMQRLIATGALALPLPGAGETRIRFRALSELGAFDLSLARLSEGHLDAVAILAEARRDPRPGLYGVWAADLPPGSVQAARTASGWTLSGRRRYASGARRLQRALVTAHTPEGSRLFDVDLSDARVRPITDTWEAIGMSATESLDVQLDDVMVREDDAVGPPGFYVSRRGFWHGAIGVAACWYGGALGALRMLRAHLRRSGSSEHQVAHLGAVAAACAMMQTTLDAAADDIDRCDPDARDGGRERALVVRHVVEQACQDVLARVGRAGGTAPLVFDRAHARRAADLVVYLRQHRAERDLAELGQLVLAGVR